MKKHQRWPAVLAALAAASFLSTVPPAQAQPARPDEAPGATAPRGYGPGMMGGYGGGPGPYGPGMMGGYGGGSGWGMGSMMGMMGLGGPGLLGMGPYYALDLSEQQRTKMSQIQSELRKKNWDVVGKLVDEQARLRELFAADKRDPAAIGKQSMKIAELRRQLLEASVDAHNRMEALLSKEQKEQWRRFGRGWMMGDE